MGLSYNASLRRHKWLDLEHNRNDAAVEDVGGQLLVHKLMFVDLTTYLNLGRGGVPTSRVQ
jgi:hypothetical protein